MTRADFSGLWDQLLSEGANTVTIDEVESRTGATRNAVYLGVKYAMDRKRLFSPARGLYVVVPAECRSIGLGGRRRSAKRGKRTNPTPTSGVCTTNQPDSNIRVCTNCRPEREPHPHRDEHLTRRSRAVFTAS